MVEGKAACGALVFVCGLEESNEDEGIKTYIIIPWY